MSERSERVGHPGAERRRRRRQRWAWPRGDLLPPLRRTRRPPRIQQRSTDDRTCSRVGGRGRRRAAGGRARHGAHRRAHRRPGGSAAGRIGGSPLLADRGRRVLRRDGCGSLRVGDCRQTTGLRRVARAANALTALAQPQSLLRTRKPPPTARYCCAAPALARRQQSLRSIDKPLRSFVAAGRGSLTVSLRAALSVGSDGVHEGRCWRPRTAFSGAPRLRYGA